MRQPGHGVRIHDKRCLQETTHHHTVDQLGEVNERSRQELAKCEAVMRTSQHRFV